LFPEDGGRMVLRNTSNYYKTIRYHDLEDHNLSNSQRENLKTWIKPVEVNIQPFPQFYTGVYKTKLNFMVWVRERTIPTERPPLVGEVIANFCG
jgi:hypothetical protein